VVRGLLIAVCAVLLLSACGGGGSRATAKHCVNPKAARAVAKIEADIAALRHAAALPTKDTFKGNAAVNRATDRFLYDTALAPIPNLQRNRLIDHAAGALHGSCEQCFQALEAGRPVVSIRYGDTGVTCQRSH